MTTKITRINQIAIEKPNEVFTSIYHLINKELLKECFNDLDGNKAVGIDKITKDDYRYNLEENLDKLVEKLKNKSYRPSPARKVNIPKANGKLRGLAIANFEDKIVQMAVKKLVEAIFEPKFTNNMFGFRPGIGCHDCLKYLNICIEKKPTNYILDADIKGYFDNISHELIIKGLETHIKDKNLLRLIRRFLKAGIMENDKYITNDYGTPQGSILSPVLANIVMYYAIILYIERLKTKARGYIEIVNYADDMVLCFQYEEEAIMVYNSLKNRLNRLGLEFAEDKTRLIEFGKCASFSRKRQGLGKPETFDFLGFTHYGSKSRNGKFRVKHRTAGKKFRKKCKQMNITIRDMRFEKKKYILEKVNQILTGYYHYYGITDNYQMLDNFRKRVIQILFFWMNRRSQRKSYTWDGFNEFLKRNPIVRPKIYVSIYG